MISVKKDFTDIPQRLASPNCKQQLTLALTEKNTHVFNGYYYRDGCRNILEPLYHFKCGFCESRVGVATVGRVDHYRPKKRVNGLEAHEGYYWLGYEWSNLIFICEICNGKKHDHFPIMDETNRLYAPPLLENGNIDFPSFSVGSNILQNEGALMLHPELDSPEDHVVFLPNGEIKGITPKGKTTIEKCGLNREQLILARKKKIDKILERLRKALKGFDEHSINEATLRYKLKDIFIDVLKAKRPRKQYSRLGFFMSTKFDLFFIQQLGEKQREVVRRAFQLFLNGVL